MICPKPFFASDRRSLLALIVSLGLLAACSDDDVAEPFDCETSTLGLVLESVQGTSACDVADGSVRVAATGGEQPYQYSVNDQVKQSDGTITGLHAGLYTVRVTDARGCSAAVGNVNVPATGLAIVADVTPDTSCLEGTGTVTLEVSEGIPPYQYRLESGEFTGENVFVGLRAGEHTISVRDDSNCEVSLNVTVSRGNSGVSWQQEILPIVEASCALSGCHDGLLRPDLRKYEKAHFYADLMKEFTQDRSMPFEGSITQDEIDLIACWVDDGAPEN